jgi:hypothetical protein
MSKPPKPSTLYVAGPMRGHDRWNFPAFRECCAYLRDLGYRVVSPHELDEAIGFTEDAEELPDGFMAEAMRRDVEALLEVDYVCLLPGWEQSTGTRFELSVAEMLGHGAVFTYNPDRAHGYRLGTLGWPGVHRLLEAADSVELEVGYLVESAAEVTMAPLPPIGPSNAAPADDTNPKDRVGVTKPQLHLVPPAAMIHAAEAMRDGAAKYGPFNWRTKAVRSTVYVSAALRHLLAYLDGEDVSADAKVKHLGHVIACCGIVLDAEAVGNLIDDRPTPGTAARLMDDLTEARA